MRPALCSALSFLRERVVKMSGPQQAMGTDGRARLDAGSQWPQGFPNSSEANSRGGCLRFSAVRISSTNPTLIAAHPASDSSALRGGEDERNYKTIIDRDSCLAFRL
jgi:hypothetical protein